MKKKFFFLLICILPCKFALGQDKTIVEKIDSAKISKDLKEFSQKSKLSRFIYKTFFRHPSSSVPSAPPRKNTRRPKVKYFNLFEGKIIRKINILAFDPFGYNLSLKDSVTFTHTLFNKIGNKIHVRSKSFAIKSLLLFRQNQPFDSLLIKESERLIRQQIYVRDVMFFYVLPPKSDSLDIYINVVDLWSIIPNGASLSPTGLSVVDYNFMGMGHRFQNAFRWNSSIQNSFYETNYLIPSISGTYISSFLQYRRDFNRNVIKRIDLERNFYTPLASWGGGINITQQLQKDSILYPDSTRILQNFKFNSQDLWLGKAWKIYNGQSENDRTTKLILAGRFERIKYTERPSVRYDSLGIYTNENLYLAGIGITSRRYIQDSYVFNYGLIEDVPIGRLQEIIAGYQLKNHASHWYLGVRIAWGNYYNPGYFSTDLEYGTFFNDYGFEQGVLFGNLNYFTNLLELGRWKFRQFVKPQFMIGIHRLATDKLYLNDQVGIKGFTSSQPYGIHKLLLTLQSQFYAPWNVFGFRFGPYFVYSMGMLGTATSGFSHSRLYSSIGIGVLVKNEFLNLRFFQVSLAFYPIIPGSGLDVFKFNPYQTTDYGFQNFDIGKPDIVLYQ